MYIDQLGQDDLKKVIAFIGNGVRPIKAARFLFPNRPTGYVNDTKNIRSYCWNRLTAMQCFKERRVGWVTYVGICAEIYMALPSTARVIRDDLFCDDEGYYSEEDNPSNGWRV